MIFETERSEAFRDKMEKEILQTEETYVKMLGILDQVYKKPLVEFVEKKSKKFNLEVFPHENEKKKREEGKEQVKRFTELRSSLRSKEIKIHCRVHRSESLLFCPRSSGNLFWMDLLFLMEEVNWLLVEDRRFFVEEEIDF